MTVTREFVETVNADTINCFFAKLKAGYPQAEKLHIILDQSMLPPKPCRQRGGAVTSH
jgi:hypothetical protein